MYTPEEIEQIHSIQERALAQLNELNIPITPVNYTLWYHYIEEANDELVAIIDTMIRKEEPFTKESLMKLHEQFCDDIPEDELQRLRDELQTMVKELYRSIGELSGQSSGFGDLLSQSAQKMAEAESVHEINEIVADLVKQTRQFGEKSDAIGNDLDAAQKELTTLKQTLSTLQEEIRRDELTGIANRKAFDEALDMQISLAKRKKRTFSVLMVDIDFFKKVNDTYGHLIGDEVLQFISRRMDALVRKEDLVARFGGEEFVILLPETIREDAIVVAEKICSHFGHTRLIRHTEPKEIGKVTVSIGVTEYHEDEDEKELLTRADYALYLAKENGRNQVRWN